MLVSYTTSLKHQIVASPSHTSFSVISVLERSSITGIVKFLVKEVLLF